MVTNNKVLTVSYGTFACTLEGFDESFEAMKAIAEYFRDLAADDRYFGAEPPTPDAEMLTRIAEREIERRVQARTEAGSIVLSAAPAVAEAQAEAPVKTDAEPLVLDASDTVAAPAPQVEAAQAAPVQPDVKDVSEDVIADVIADVAVASAEDDLTEIAEEADEVSNNMFEEEYDSLTAAIDTISSADDDEDIVNVAHDPEAEAPEEDSIAAKLRRIRAVVSTQEAAPEADDFIEDQHAEDMTAPIADTFEAAEPAIEMAAEAKDEDIADLDLEEDDLELTEPSPVPVAPAATKPRARVIRMKRAQFEDAVENGLLEEEDSLDLPEAAPVAEAPVETPAPQPAPKAAPVAETSLSRDDEDELMAELSALDAELGLAPEEESPIPATAEVEEAPVEVAEEPVAPVRPRRARRALEPATEDAAVDRLLAEANTKLDEPEGKGRRSAIAHLRAAVAATKAEKEAGSSLKKENSSDAYRADLADAVRPRKSAAPLKLVAEQRVDGSEETVRPRRVAVQEADTSAPNERMADFVEFAESQGATQLPEVLEAAASYMTFVEGRQRFSRPMLMRLAYQVGEQPFEREAGLASFGQLLRDKKIEKIAGGRFTASEAINFKPSDRAAG